MVTTTALLPTFKRAEFQGRTDKYSPPMSIASVDLKLNEVLTGTKPIDVSGSVLGDRYVQDSVTRLTSYRKLWNYYNGRHFSVDWEGGRKKIAWNFCRKIVDKRSTWIAGKGFNFVTVKGNELVGQVLERVWQYNRKEHLIRRTAKVALTLGDAFWYFTVKTKDRMGNDLPKEQWKVRIYPLNPQYVFPLFVEDDPTEMKACMIQFPMWGDGNKKTVIFTAFYTPEKVRFYIDYQPQKEVDNSLGQIPIVHLASNVFGDQTFGNSCLEDIIPLNDNYNEIANSISKILNYHGEPTTLVYGTKLANMERGANKVWSNLPPPNECRVDNLEMKSDLKAAQDQLHRLEQHMYRHGKTPKIVFDSEGLAISNTSGVALHLTYQPLIEATLEEQDVFDIAIRKGNEIISNIHRIAFGEDLAFLADDSPNYLEMDLQWNSLLPKDEQRDLDIGVKKLEAGIWSKAEATRRLAGVKDTERLALELAADNRFEIAIAAEKARALQLGASPPNFSSVFTSSMFLSEDLLDVAKQMGDDAENNVRTDGTSGGEGDTPDTAA